MGPMTGTLLFDAVYSPEQELDCSRSAVVRAHDHSEMLQCFAECVGATQEKEPGLSVVAGPESKRTVVC